MPTPPAEQRDELAPHHLPRNMFFGGSSGLPSTAPSADFFASLASDAVVLLLILVLLTFVARP